MFVVETEHLKDVRRAARDIEWAIGTDGFGRQRTWDELRYSQVRELWLRLAQRFVSTGQGGRTWTERCVVTLRQVSNWLLFEEKIERAIPIRHTWRDQLGREWEQITAAPKVERDLRHTEEEITRIFAVLNHEDVDPRIALALELGAEARLGQVRRLRRSNIDLSPIVAFSLGRLVVEGRPSLGSGARIPGRGTHRLLRVPGRQAPLGHTSKPPAPPRLADDRASGASGANRPARQADRTMTDMFHALERVAGVEPGEGRGWYGVRRIATAVFEDYESDERVLNSATGHSSSEMRRKRYQQRNRDKILAKTAVTRRRVLAGAFGRGPSDAGAERGPDDL
jgi:integrase